MMNFNIIIIDSVVNTHYVHDISNWKETEMTPKLEGQTVKSETEKTLRGLNKDYTLILRGQEILYYHIRLHEWLKAETQQRLLE